MSEAPQRTVPKGDFFNEGTDVIVRQPVVGMGSIRGGKHVAQGFAYICFCTREAI